MNVSNMLSHEETCKVINANGDCRLLIDGMGFATVRPESLVSLYAEIASILAASLFINRDDHEADMTIMADIVEDYMLIACYFSTRIRRSSEHMAAAIALISARKTIKKNGMTDVRAVITAIENVDESTGEVQH